MTVEHEPALARVKKLRIRIAKFDLIANGGLPRGRTTLVSGAAGPRDEFPFTITSGQGIVVILLSFIEKLGGLACCSFHLVVRPFGK